MRVFVDSNIPMYVAGREHPNRQRALQFMQAVRAGDIHAVTSTEVLQEILYRYAGMRRLDLGRSVYDLFVQLCEEVLPVSLADTDLARDLLCEGKAPGARDAVHAAVMLNHGLKQIATFDTGFDRVPGIQRHQSTTS